jgi:hypothetical protein
MQESLVIGKPLMPTGRAIVAHILAIYSLLADACDGANKGGLLGKWIPSIVALTATIDGWLTVGPVAQAALIGAALLRRLTRLALPGWLGSRGSLLMHQLFPKGE